MTIDSDLGPISVPESVPPSEPSKPSKRRYAGKRNPHLGVSIVRPSEGQVRWRLRWKSPDTGKWTFCKLSDAEARNEQTRRDAAIKQWESLQDRKLNLKGGAEKFTNGDMLIKTAIDGFYAGAGMLLADRTRDSYKSRTNAFLDWLALPGVDIHKCGDVTTTLLRAYRSFTISRKAQGTNKRVAEGTVNAAMWGVGAVLGELAKGNLIPLSASAVTEALETVKDHAEKLDFLRSAQLRLILEACAKYDADASLRSQIRGRMFATILFILLTGMRSGEALKIEWRDVGQDPDGKPCINVRKEVAKNKKARRIYLAHSPLLAHLVANRRADNARVIGVGRSVLATARWTIEGLLGLVFDCKSLRRTCGTFLTCAPSIFGAAAPYMSARQLGHTVQIAEKNYLGLMVIDPAHKTTEAAMDLRVNIAECPQL